MTYRNDLDALEARHAALEADVATKTRERDAAAHLLEDAKARAKLPVLDNIGVATPCRAEWATMTGTEHVRACSACDKDVYNISSLTRDEAEALIAEKNGKLCVRYFQRTDGTILLADCTIGKAAARRRKLIAAGAVALLAGGGVAAHHALQRDPDPTIDEITVMPENETPAEHVTGNAYLPPPPAPVLVPRALETPHIHETVGVLMMKE